MTRERERKNGQRAGHLDKYRQSHDVPAPEPVRSHTSNDHQHQRRQKLDQSDPAQQSRILCLVIDLPADRDRNDLHAE
jgi:hypothetical protein